MPVIIKNKRTGRTRSITKKALAKMQKVSFVMKQYEVVPPPTEPEEVTALKEKMKIENSGQEGNSPNNN